MNNEDVFGTQVERQLQDGTVCALCVSCCKFGLVSCIFPELQNCQCSTAVGHPPPGGWIHISVCPDLPELLFLSTRFSRKNYINWNLSFSHLCEIRLNPQFIKYVLCHRPVASLEVVLLCEFRHVNMWTASTWRDGSSTGHPREVASKKESRLCRWLIGKSDFVSQPSISYRLYKFRPPLIFVRAIRTSSLCDSRTSSYQLCLCRIHFETKITGGPAVLWWETNGKRKENKGQHNFVSLTFYLK